MKNVSQNLDDRILFTLNFLKEFKERSSTAFPSANAKDLIKIKENMIGELRKDLWSAIISGSDSSWSNNDKLVLLIKVFEDHLGMILDLRGSRGENIFHIMGMCSPIVLNQILLSEKLKENREWIRFSMGKTDSKGSEFSNYLALSYFNLLIGDLSPLISATVKEQFFNNQNKVEWFKSLILLQNDMRDIAPAFFPSYVNVAQKLYATDTSTRRKYSVTIREISEEYQRMVDSAKANEVFSDDRFVKESFCDDGAIIKSLYKSLLDRDEHVFANREVGIDFLEIFNDMIRRNCISLSKEVFILRLADIIAGNRVMTDNIAVEIVDLMAISKNMVNLNDVLVELKKSSGVWNGYREYGSDLFEKMIGLIEKIVLSGDGAVTSRYAVRRSI